MDGLRRRLRLEIVLAALSAVLCALTLVVPEWIEELTGGWEPDSGSGALEWIIAGGSSSLQWCLPCLPVGTTGVWRPTGHRYT